MAPILAAPARIPVGAGGARDGFGTELSVVIVAIDAAFDPQ